MNRVSPPSTATRSARMATLDLLARDQVGSRGTSSSVSPTRTRPAATASPRTKLVRPEEARDEAVGGLRVGLLRRVELLHAAAVHDQDAVRHDQRLALVVGDVDGGDAELALDAAELELHLLAQLAVQGGQRLVEQEQVGLEHQRAGDRHALLLAAGQLVRAAMAEAGRVGRAPGSARPAARSRRCGKPRIRKG